MAVILTRLRVEVRTRWRAWGAVAFLIGFAGGAVLATAAGSRRTGSAYARFLVASHGSDLLVSPGRTGIPSFYKAVARQTGATVTPVIGFGATPESGPVQPLLFEARMGFGVEQPKLIAGRMLRVSSASEVVASGTAARLFHLHAGSRLRLRVAKSNEPRPDPLHDPLVTVRVVGIGVTRDGVVSVNALADTPTLTAGPAFARRFSPAYYAFDGAYVTLPAGASKTTFTAKVQAMARRFPETGGQLFVADESEQAAKVEHAIRPEAVALALFATLIAVTAVFALGQVLARQLFLGSTENHVLRALGVSRRQLFATGLAEVGAVAALGACLAVVVAVLASAAMPIGPARIAEPHPGIAFDWFVLGIGFVLIVAVLVASVAWSAWRVASQPGEGTRPDDWLGRRPSRLGRWITAIGAPPSVAIGVGYAVDRGRGRTAVPVRSAIAVTALAIAAIAASLTFGANLSHLVQTPPLYGQSWDVTADAQFAPVPAPAFAALLNKEPGVTGWTFGAHGLFTIDRQVVPAIGLIPGKGPLLTPTVIEGQAAQQPHDITLGTKTLDNVHRDVGQTIIVGSSADTAGPSGPMRIVGRSVFPFFGLGSFTPTGLGVGAQVAYTPPKNSNPALNANFVLIRVAPGPEHDAHVARLVHDLARRGCTPVNQCAVSTAIRPTDILNYTRVQLTPIVLAAVLALLAIAVVTNLLVTSLRRRRHDIAILKTLGFARRQISATVAWQATSLVAVALLIGLPIGTAIGREAWATFAHGLGIQDNTRSPIDALLIAIPIALFLGNANAAIPGLLAQRARPATALRTE